MHVYSYVRKQKPNYRIHRQIYVWKKPYGNGSVCFTISFLFLSLTRFPSLSLTVCVSRCAISLSRTFHLSLVAMENSCPRVRMPLFLTTGIKSDVGSPWTMETNVAVSLCMCVLLFRTLQNVNIDLYNTDWERVSYRNGICGCIYTMSGSIGNDKWAFWILCLFHICHVLKGRGGV